MFWRFGGYANISTIDSILDKQDVTLEELLDESDLIQELKQQNSKLVEFLREESRLQKLLKYVTADPKSDQDVFESEAKEEGKDTPAEEDKSISGISFFGKGKGRARSKSAKGDNRGADIEQEKKEARRKKYAYVACEVLSSEVWSITEALFEPRTHLCESWQYLHRSAPLDPLQAGYFTKVNESLLDKKTEEMLALFKSLDNVVPAMLQHVDCPMIMDLLLKIISLEKHEGGQGIVDWLQSQGFVPLILGYLSPEYTSATQTSAGDFLKAIITISANATTQDQSVIGPNELTRQLVSEPCIKTLIEAMLGGGNALTVGVGIIIEVIRKNNSDYDLDNQVGPEPKTSDPIYLGTLLRSFAEHIPDFMRLIRAPSAKKPDLKAAFGGTVEPLGFDRFKTCELMAELLHCSNMALLNERGADAEVRSRDAKRERLKAEGKLAAPRAPHSPGNEHSHDEFGSSVDSHGFHHAERPSDDEMNQKLEDIRKLEIQNTSDEDGFEKVNAPSDDLPDEVTFDDLNEKIDFTTHGGLPLLEKVEKRDPSDPQNQSPHSPISPSAIPQPLSPKKQSSPPKPQLYFDPPPTHAADSPSTAEATDRLNKLDVDEDTVMSEFGEEPKREGKQTSAFTQQFQSPQSLSMDVDEEPPVLEKDVARPEDKPAPLFAKKEQPVQDDLTASSYSDGEQSQDIEQSTATLHAQEPGTLSDSGRELYETELDGRPVVGDLLKIQFVEHRVVPTILDFFFRFPWNNFLHNVVYDVVQQVFNGTLDRGYNRTLAFDLFKAVEVKYGESVDDIGLISLKDITDRILDGQAASDVSQKNKGMRLGYMGHLTLIAEEVCKFGNRHPPEVLDEHVTERVSREEWISYVDGTLAETRDKDHAILGGVRPENAVGARQTSIGGGNSGGFSSNTANTLANAGLGGGGNMTPQDSLALSEGTVGQSFEINSGTMLSRFADTDDEDMEDEAITREREMRAAFAEDEQTSPDGNKTSVSVAPLKIPPSRARLTLAARLAQRSQDTGTTDGDPDAADAAAVDMASLLPDESDELQHADRGGDVGLKLLELRTVSGASGMARGSRSKFSGFLNSDDDSSDGELGSEDSSLDFDEDDAGRDLTLAREGGDYDDPTNSSARMRWRRTRRPSTTEAKERRPLDDGDEDDHDDDDDDEDDDDDDSDDVLEMADIMERKSVLPPQPPQPPFFSSSAEVTKTTTLPVSGREGEGLSSDEGDDEGLVEIRPRKSK